jgi:hypothetical protein
VAYRLRAPSGAEAAVDSLALTARLKAGALSKLDQKAVFHNTERLFLQWRISQRLRKKLVLESRANPSG